MKGWKSNIFGDTTFNFFGWIITGALLLAGSAWLALRALDSGAFDSPVALMLGAIYLLLLGLFGLALQNYCARMAAALEAEASQ